MPILSIVGTDGHGAAQSPVDRFIRVISSLGIGLEVETSANGFGIIGNICLVGIHHIGHALQLVLRSSPAGYIIGLPYGPGGIVQSGEIITAPSGIIAIGLRAHLDAAGRHRIEAGDVLGQFQGKGGAVGRDADITAICQIRGASGNGEGVVKSNAALSRVSGQLEAIAEGSHGMSRAIPVGIADAARAIGAGEFRRSGIARRDGRGFIGIFAVCSNDLDGADFAVICVGQRCACRHRIEVRILVQGNGQALISCIGQNLHILRGVFFILLGTAALEQERAALVQVDRGTRVIALEVHALACQSFELSHVDSIGVLGTGGQIRDLAADGLVCSGFSCVSSAQGNSTRSGHPGRCLGCIGRICHIRCQITGRSLSPIGYRVSAQGYAAFYIGLRTGTKSRGFYCFCLSRIAVGSRAGFCCTSTITNGNSTAVVGRLYICILRTGLSAKAHGNGVIAAGIAAVAHSYRLRAGCFIAIADGQRVQARSGAVNAHGQG